MIWYHGGKSFVEDLIQAAELSEILAGATNMKNRHRRGNQIEDFNFSSPLCLVSRCLFIYGLVCSDPTRKVRLLSDRGEGKIEKPVLSVFLSVSDFLILSCRCYLCLPKNLPTIMSNLEDSLQTIKHTFPDTCPHSHTLLLTSAPSLKHTH